MKVEQYIEMCDTEDAYLVIYKDKQINWSGFAMNWEGQCADLYVDKFKIEWASEQIYIYTKEIIKVSTVEDMFERDDELIVLYDYSTSKLVWSGLASSLSLEQLGYEVVEAMRTKNDHKDLHLLVKIGVL